MNYFALPKPMVVTLFYLLTIAVSCTPAKDTAAEEPLPITQYMESQSYMASTAHPLATAAANAMFEKGGNAVDAAVAAGFALSVVEPSMSGLGGRMQMIIRLADGRVVGIDGTTQAPDTYDQETAPQASYGYAVIGIPGVVRGLTKALREHGTLSLKEVMAPAIHYAENGFEILRGEAFRHSLAIDQIKEFPGTAGVYLSGDSTLTTGDLWIQKDLAETLKLIAEQGDQVFYSGKIAETLISDNQSHGGVLTAEALDSYEARDAEIVTGEYRGYTVHGLGMPAFGGISIEMLNLLELIHTGGGNDMDWAQDFARAHAWSYNDRQRLYADYSLSESLASKSYARAYYDSMMRLDSAMSFSSDLPEGMMAEWGHTTHLSTADQSGMMVALTQSNGPNMGSKVVTPGLGFLHASTLGGYLGDFQPGQRAASHISPMIVEKDGKPYLVLGAAGGRQIVTAIVQVMSRMIDQGVRIDSALAAGRVYSYDTLVQFELHPGSTWLNENISDFTGAEIDSVLMPGRFGRVHAIHYDPTQGVFRGAADPDWEGTVYGK